MNQKSTNERLEEIMDDSSYRLAYLDQKFLCREDMRPLRLELELLKPEMLLEEQGVKSTVVVFGGTQIKEECEAQQMVADAASNIESDPDDAGNQRAMVLANNAMEKSHYYDECREFAKIVSTYSMQSGGGEYVIKTGGGPGIMEAANRGAYDVGARSIGLNIILPFEQVPNEYITPGLCFQFNYFAIRKMHFLLRAKALVCFPGGFGTLDELFTTLTLRQTQRMQEIPIILYSKDYWTNILNFDYLADSGVIQDHHLDLFQYASTPEETWKIITDYHGVEA